MRGNLSQRYLTIIRRRRGIILSRWRRFITHFHHMIDAMSTVLATIVCVLSVCCIGLMVIYVGFEHSPSRANSIMSIIRVMQGVFVAYVIYGMLFERDRSRLGAAWVKWIIDIGVLSTLLPLLYPQPDDPWIPSLASLLYSRAYLFGVLGVYSIVELCYCMMRMVGRRTNPSLLMTGSFVFFILIGSLVLMLPKCTLHPISYVDSLFVSTSAVCITGLTPVDIPTTFTPLGLMCLMLLVQIGGLGVLTFTSFFAIFFSGQTSIYNQLLIRDLVYSRTIGALIPTLRYIIVLTLSIEAIGAVAIYLTVPPDLGLNVDERLMFAAFHSMSSFCNAGFSCLPGGMSNPALMTSGCSIYLVTSVLILAGAIGFPILVNFKDIIIMKARRFVQRIAGRRPAPDKVHIYDVNTKIVLTTTLILLAIGTVGFFVLEYDNTLRGMSLGDKATQSLFNALAPRSAGFSSVNPAAFLPATMLLVLFQMWVGGASQSMAGGIKVNSLGAALLNLRSIVLGHKGVAAFNRNLSAASVRRANAVIILSIITLLLYSLAMLVMEPDLPARSVVFETVSALFTVGSSLGITDSLHDSSKILLSTAMLLGRVGIVSLLCSFVGTQRDRSTLYPGESIIIN